jgi:hypothetical protein
MNVAAGFSFRRLNSTGSHSLWYRGPLLAVDLIMVQGRVISGVGVGCEHTLFGAGASNRLYTFSA